MSYVCTWAYHRGISNTRLTRGGDIDVVSQPLTYARAPNPPNVRRVVSSSPLDT